MAESRRAKLARWARGDFTEGEYQGIIAGFVFDQVVDVATGGKLSALKKKAGQKILWPLVKGGTMVGARAGLSVAGSAARAAVPLVTNPYLAELL